ncbi:MAG: sulfite exporter TauE/SafE family protein [Gammaproteobacteria bacterium]|nr:sulfite exporter TauE/SafE family protein [Gammaproteobacteria bacterium]MBU1443503.1 sulfite exporter TauE/SafE family protein [Gammaproteobacteria bacterium]
MIASLSLTLGALIAGIISGATGFGFALAATAMWSLTLEPRLVAVLAVVFTTVLNLGYLPVFWRDIDLRRLAPFAVGCFGGVPLGAYALATLPAPAIRLWIGVLLLGYGSYRLVCRPSAQLQLSPVLARTGDVFVGFLGGVFGGLGGLSGFLPALWCGLRNWDKRSQRALLQSYILFANFLSMAWIGGLVGIDAAAGGAILLGLPFVVVGGWLGLRLFARFDTPTFNRVVLWVIAGCGLLLVLHPS